MSGKFSQHEDNRIIALNFYIGTMKTGLLLIGFLLLAGFSDAQSQDLSEKQIAFANRFVAAVQDHNYKKVYKCLDKAYRKEQSKFLGDKIQLMDELLSGADGDSYIVMKITDITKIEIAEVISLKGYEGTTYIFRIRDGSHDVLASLLLKKIGKKFGFVGALG